MHEVAKMFKLFEIKICEISLLWSNNSVNFTHLLSLSFILNTDNIPIFEPKQNLIKYIFFVNLTKFLFLIFYKFIKILKNIPYLQRHTFRLYLLLNKHLGNQL